MATSSMHRTGMSAVFGKPSSEQMALFIRIYADLLQQQFPYDEALAVAWDGVKHQGLRRAIDEILRDLKEGKSAREAFGGHVNVLGRFTTRMLIVGFSSGNMAAVCDALAHFLERDLEMRMRLRRLILPPVVMGFILLNASSFFALATSPFSVGAVIQFFRSLLPLRTLSVAAMVVFMLKHRGARRVLDYSIIRLPIVESLMHQMSIERFARAFHAVYTHSSDIIPALRVAGSVCGNRYMEAQIARVTIPMMKRGRGLMESLEASKAFTRGALVMLRSGHVSGSLRKANLRLANYCANSISHRIKMLITGADALLGIVIGAWVLSFMLNAMGQMGTVMDQARELLDVVTP